MATESFGCFFLFCFALDNGERSAASGVFSYLRVDLKDRVLCREKRRENCEPLPDVDVSVKVKLGATGKDKIIGKLTEIVRHCELTET